MSVRLSVCLSVRMEKLVSHWTDFHGILYLSIFRKTLQKIQVSLKSRKYKDALHEDQYIFLSYLDHFFLVVEKIEAQLSVQ